MNPLPCIVAFFGFCWFLVCALFFKVTMFLFLVFKISPQDPNKTFLAVVVGGFLGTILFLFFLPWDYIAGEKSKEN